jgi:hypothetical protein
MPERGQGRGRGRCQRGEGQSEYPMGRDDARPDGPRVEPGTTDDGGDALIRHGRSADSPGHRKRAAGAQSARDFAPGRARKG